MHLSRYLKLLVTKLQEDEFSHGKQLTQMLQHSAAQSEVSRVVSTVEGGVTNEMSPSRAMTARTVAPIVAT